MVLGGDVNSIIHDGETCLLYQHCTGANVYSALGVHRLRFFCTVVLLFCQLQFVIVSSGRVLIQEEAALAVLPGAGGERKGWTG